MLLSISIRVNYLKLPALKSVRINRLDISEHTIVLVL